MPSVRVPRPRSWRRIAGRSLVLLLLSYGVLYLWHRPFRRAESAPTPTERFEHMAHRGVHQNFPAEGVGRDTCTATRIHPPSHAFLENSLPGIAAAFAAGADRVEIDLQLSRDGVLMVFHDWTLECRTEGRGETRAHTLAELKQLDIGYGYSADGGRSFPFRGRFVGAMPTLSEVLDAFPDGRFLLDQKDPAPRLTAALIALLRARGADAVAQVCLQSRPERQAEFRAALGPTACTWADRPQTQACYLAYMQRFWSRTAPAECAASTFIAPDWLAARLIWSWPGGFVDRLHAAGSRVLVLSDDPTRAEHYRQLGFDGVWTNWIERWPESRAPSGEETERATGDA